MATFSEMKTFVSKRLQDPNNTAVSSEDVGDMINQAIDYYKNTRFYFNEKTDTVTLTHGDNTVPLPDDYYIPSLQDGGMVIEYSGVRYVLTKLSEMVYNAYYLTNGVGQPFWYSKQSNEGYLVYPIPDKDYTLRLFYLKTYDALEADDDENDWTTIATNLIQYQALAYGSRDFRQDTAMADKFEAQADLEYINLLNTTRKQNATGALTINGGIIANF